MSPWPRRTAYAAVALALPIFLLGGTVTTLRVGMAVPDWPTTFGQNMFTYPLSEMLANTGVFFEHSHRLWGALVGLATLALVAAHMRFEPRALVRGLAFGAFVLVCAQGVLGGLRVLENSPNLAFVHGALAQALFALYVSVAVMHGRAWRASEERPCKRALALRRVALATSAVVYAQIVVGGVLRHSGQLGALALHVILAALATGSVVALARELRLTAEAGAAGGHDRSALLVVRARLVWLLGLQLTLGVLATVWIYVVTGPHNPVSIGEAIFATAHVAVGAVLLAQCVTASQWAFRIVTPARGVVAPSASLGGSR